MGAVYRARRMLLGDDVAIKVILADVAGSPAPRERFVRESRACARLRHPNIVSILDYNTETRGHPFLVMELLNGPSLKDELAQRGRLSIEDVQRIVPPVCAALAVRAQPRHHPPRPEAGQHRRARVHAGRARLQARRLRRSRTSGESDAETRGSPGPHEFIGTIAYAVARAAVRRQSSMRARTSTAGRRGVRDADRAGAVPGDDPMAVLNGHLSSPVPRPSSLRPGLPAWLDVAVGPRAREGPRGPVAGHRGVRPGAVGAGAKGDRRRSIAVRRRLGTARAPTRSGERLGPGRLGSEGPSRRAPRARASGRDPPAARATASATGKAARARFLREAQALQVAHPSIIQVRDYGEEGDLVYVVTDFIEGPSLRELMQACGPLPWPRLQRLAAQLLEAAHVLHRRKGLLCGLNARHHAHRHRRRRGAADDLERGHLGGAGSAGDAAGTDAARHRRWPTPSCATWRRSSSPDGRPTSGRTSSRWVC